MRYEQVLLPPAGPGVRPADIADAVSRWSTSPPLRDLVEGQRTPQLEGHRLAVAERSSVRPHRAARFSANPRLALAKPAKSQRFLRIFGVRINISGHS